METIIIILAFILAIITFYWSMFWILDLNSSDWRMTGENNGFITIPLFVVCLLTFFNWLYSIPPVIKTEYQASNLISQEFESCVEYKEKNGNLVYRLTDIKEYNQRKNIVGFINETRVGWGPDSIVVKPIFNTEETK